MRVINLYDLKDSYSKTENKKQLGEDLVNDITKIAESKFKDKFDNFIIRIRLERIERTYR